MKNKKRILYIFKKYNLTIALGLIVLLLSCKEATVTANKNENSQKDQNVNVYDFSPLQGPVGTTVIIKGAHFSLMAKENEVRFGNKEATVKEASSGKIKVLVPDGLSKGKVTITVSVDGVSSTVSDKFQVMKGKDVVINRVYPSEGEPGRIVYIDGQNFNPDKDGDIVYFGDYKAQVMDADSSRLTVKVPEDIKEGEVPVSVTIGNQSVQASDDFMVFALDFTSDYAYPLNVVYFSPADNPPLPLYKERLSKILLKIQGFYGKWMKKWGYGDVTFGLLTDQKHQRVKIIRVVGKKSYTEYAYAGGSEPAKAEIRAYLSKHPGVKTSDHFLVFLPAWPGKAEGGPYYGGGRWCFAADNQYMNVSYLGLTGDKGNGATKYIGGLAHELGHGLNLPHNGPKVSEQKEYGMPMMSAGNFTYGQKPTFLTKSSCAILSVTQVCSRADRDFYRQESVQLKSLSGHYKNGKIIFSGKYKTEGQVSSIIVYNNNPDNSYLSVPWVVSPIAEDSFYVEMPAKEIPEDNRNEYVLSLKFVFENGTLIDKSVPGYAFNNQIPDIDFDFNDKEPFKSYSRDNWSVVGASSFQQGEGKPSNVLDGEKGTYWHSRWSPNPEEFPHWIEIDMGEIKEIHGFSFIQRIYGRRIKDFTIKVSADNHNWTSLGDFQLISVPFSQRIKLDQRQEARYVKIITHSSWDGSMYSCLAELGVF